MLSNYFSGCTNEYERTLGKDAELFIATNISDDERLDFIDI
jgi:hypothetical protein